MITCQQAQNLFEGYLNDELSSALTAELDAHRLECPSCRHHLTLMEACGNVVRLDLSEPQVSGDFTDRLMAILDGDGPRRGWLQINRSMKITAGLLGLAAAIGLVVVLYPNESPEPITPWVAGEKVEPTKPISAADLITDLPIDLLLNATDSVHSSIDLARQGVDHLTGAADSEADLPGLPDYLIDMPQAEPSLEVLDVQLPDLDDGGELM